MLPQLAAIEDSSQIGGLLVLLNTMEGDVEAGLAIAEMIASLSKPTVSLVLGGSDSIGVPIAVSTDYSFIVPTGTMVIHPVRMNGTVIGAPQTFDYLSRFRTGSRALCAATANVTQPRMEALMMNQGMLYEGSGHDFSRQGSGAGGHHFRGRRHERRDEKAAQPDGAYV